MATLPFFAVNLRAPLHCLGPKESGIWRCPARSGSIGEAIRKRRLELQLRQKEVAKIIGCDPMSLVNWERGHTQPHVNHMAAIVKFLGFNPMPIGDNVAQRLISHRLGLGLTQEQFASDLEVDPSTLARWESGQRMPQGKFITTVELKIGSLAILD